MKIEIPKEIIDDIQHLILWYQGRSVNRCDRVQKFVDNIKTNIQIKKVNEKS